MTQVTQNIYSFSATGKYVEVLEKAMAASDLSKAKFLRKVILQGLSVAHGDVEAQKLLEEWRF